MSLLWWGCPEWLCSLLGKHSLTREWANYNTDQSGKRCNCGRFFTDDGINKVNDQQPWRGR